MVNGIVIHNKFGQGVIIGAEDNHVTVRFGGEGGERKFRYPDAFDVFLKFSDGDLQKKAREDLAKLNEEKELLRIERQCQYELREEQRKKEQKELLKRRRRAVKERLERENRSRVFV